MRFLSFIWSCDHAGFGMQRASGECKATNPPKQSRTIRGSLSWRIQHTPQHDSNGVLDLIELRKPAWPTFSLSTIPIETETRSLWTHNPRGDGLLAFTKTRF